MKRVLISFPAITLVFASILMFFASSNSLLAGFRFPQDQQGSGVRVTLSGNVTDPSGAAIPGVLIEVRTLDTPGGEVAHTRSDQSGNFEVSVPVGRYRLSASAPAFTREEQVLNVDQSQARWSVRLSLERLSSQVVVSASAEPTPAVDAPVLVDVLTKRDIDERQEIWLASLLTSAPGATISQLGPMGGVTSFFLDGGDFNFTKFLVDGVPINQPGGAIEIENYDLEGVDKVEIVHGASSAMYGSDAVSGVVQVLSHRGTTSEPELDLLSEGGAFSTAMGTAQLSGLLGRFDYSASAGYFRSDGQGPNDYFRDVPFSGNFGWKFSDTDSVRLTVREAESDAGVPGQTLLLAPSFVDHDDLKNLATGLTWRFSTGEHWQHQIEVSDSRIQQAFINSFGNAYNLFNRFDLNEQSSYLFSKGSASVGYMYEVENGSEGGPHSRRNNQAGYAEVRYDPVKRVTVTVGARAEANDSFGTRVVPRVGVAYAVRYGHDFWGATRLRGSYGSGIKEPDFFDSFSQDPCDPGNPNLAPERSSTFSVGADQMLSSDRLRVSADYFYNSYYDIVSFSSFPPTPTCPFGAGAFFNTDKARAAGAHGAFESKFWKWLRVTGNYTYDDSKVIKAPNFFDPTLAPGNRLAKRPLHSATLIANAHFWRTNFNLAGYYVGRRTDSDFLGLGITSNPSYVRWDLATSVALTQGLSGVVRVENLFDRHYQDAIGYPALGLNYRAGIRYTWGGGERAGADMQ